MGGMNIKEQLSCMSYSQLCNVRRWVKEAIDRKLNEDKVAIWMVCDDDLNYACFPKNEFKKASEKMAELAVQLAREWPDHSLTLMIQERLIAESEVEEYMKLNEGG